MVTRLRWRLRGATMWPAFAAATFVEAFLWRLLPAAGDGPDYFLGAFLIAMALNLIVVAVVAPMAGMVWRRSRRPDLPRAIAIDQAGTVLLGVLLALTVVVGVLHHRGLARDDRERGAAYAAMSNYVHNQAPEVRGRLGRMDAVKVEDGVWRACVPMARAGRALCAYVNVAQSPPGVTRDGDQIPNAQWRN